MSLSRLGRSLVRFFIPVAEPTIPLVFQQDGNNYAIQSWAKYIKISEAQECFVKSVDHRRSTNEHEFLLITLWHPGDFEAHMLAERRTMSDSGTSFAEDRIRFDACPKDSHSLRCWLFRDSRPSVADLCSILYVVSIHFPSHRPDERQSSLFVRTAYEVLTGEYLGREVAGRKPAAQASLSPDAGVVLKIRSTYKTVWEEFINKITAEREEQLLELARAKGRQEGLEEGRAAGRAEREAEIKELRRQLTMNHH